MLVLKEYQQRVLDTLCAYFSECSRTKDANTAFYSTTLNVLGTGIPYNPVKEFPGLPYVCLRIPTGGGKTLIAAHTVAVAAKELLHTENPVVLWLVPSNAIKEQTLKALKDRSHPYRQALESTIGNINACNVEDALYIKPSDLDSSVSIIVSTLQSFRVEDTLGRRVYRTSGHLMDHFKDIPSNILEGLEKGENRNILYSLANVLFIRSPIIIVDEAHNARTNLSFDTLKRFSPSCIIEFTATPDKDKNPSNVLHSVSAAELKAEAMIKMPIHLETRQNWKELLSDAIACRKNLEKIANLERQQSGEYIRPIMLLQAQPHNKNQETISVEQVKESLVNELKIPENEIVIATGAKNELDDIENILVEECKVRYVITMQALREGWDCPFAYVLCSVAEVHSPTAVEQILGRVMRLPKASWKNHAELNKAYAFSASSHFNEVANSLADALVQSGFEKQEAKDLIIQAPVYQASLSLDDKKPFLGTVIVDIPEIPKSLKLEKELKERVSIDKTGKKLIFQGIMQKSERDEIKTFFTTEEGKASVETAYRLSRGLPAKDSGIPSEQEIDFSIPYLAVKQGDLFEQFEETHFLEIPWKLIDRDALLSQEEYSKKSEASQHGEIDIGENGHIQSKFISSLQYKMELFNDNDLSISDLVQWLDKNIPHIDLSPTETEIFLSNAIRSLIDQRGFALPELNQDRFRLKQALADKINKHRGNVRNQSYQLFLDPQFKTPLTVQPDNSFTFDPSQYPFSYAYSGDYEWKKHYYPEVGNLDARGEEFECAQYLDQMDEVEFWVRNLERRSNHSFWLQTSTDKFYPDFVCKLKDGRFLVIEYKGEDRWSNDDSKEKRVLGELWEKRSNGKCLFVMPKGKDFNAIKGKL